jgi:hypothetical protein
LNTPINGSFFARVRLICKLENIHRVFAYDFFQFVPLWFVGIILFSTVSMVECSRGGKVTRSGIFFGGKVEKGLMG